MPTDKQIYKHRQVKHEKIDPFHMKLFFKKKIEVEVRMPFNMRNGTPSVWSTQSIFLNIINAQSLRREDLSNVCHQEIKKLREVGPIWKNIVTDTHKSSALIQTICFKKPISEVKIFIFVIISTASDWKSVIPTEE